MDEEPDFEQAVDEVVETAQNLDRWKQRMREEIRSRGANPDEVRIIVGHKVGDDWTATEIQGYPH
ncbi:hypothetical protein [Streptomyces olivaceoviridis]|uniref:hypothetical protein n=1 Tax=Streptomyces olivaceoviridis TaxID=1921 RepID=UPI0036A39EA9